MVTFPYCDNLLWSQPCHYDREGLYRYKLLSLPSEKLPTPSFLHVLSKMCASQPSPKWPLIVREENPTPLATLPPKEKFSKKALL